MTGSTTPDFDSLTVDGAARAGSVQSTGTGVITAGSVGSADILRITPRSSGTGPLVATDGPGAKVGMTLNAKGSGQINISNGTFSIQAPAYTLSGSALTPAIFSGQTWNGATTASSPQFNRLNITDNVDGSGAGTAVFGFAVNHTYGSGRSGRIGIVSTVTQSAAQVGTGDANTYQAGQFTLFPSFSEPGSTALAPLGAFEALSSNVRLRAASPVTNSSGITSFEADVGIEAGCSAAQRTGVLVGSDAPVQGYQIDAGYWLIAGPGGSGQFRHGQLFGGTQGFPIEGTAGTFIGYAPLGFVTNPPGPAKYGLDLSAATFPSTGNPEAGGFLRGNHWGVDGAGTTRIGTAYLTPDSSGLTIDAKGSECTACTIASGGTGYVDGQHAIETPQGGLLLATASGGVFSGTVTIINPPSINSTTTPGNPVTAIDRFRNGTGGGTGLTLNLSWSTTRNAVSIQPTAGGKLSFNGATPVVKPTGVAVTAAGIHAALVSLGLIAP